MTLRSIINLSLSLLLVLNLVLLLVPSALCAPIDGWNAVMVEGSAHKFDRRYELAAQSFAKAVSLAEKEKLPPKCLPLSLCHLADIELIMNKVSDDDSNFKRLIVLLKSQKECKTLDEELRSKADFLADQYQKNQKPELRELCLKRSCYLKTLLHGNSNQQCTDCLSQLADCYIDEDKVDQAIKILAFMQPSLDKQLGKDPDRLGNTLNDFAIKCKKARKYEQAKQLELAVIKIAKRDYSTLSVGLPAFYCFLGMNALAQDKTIEAKKYMQNAICECSRITNQKKRGRAELYMRLLVSVCTTDHDNKRSSLAAAEFKELLEIFQAAKIDENVQFIIYTGLPAIMASQRNMDYHAHTRYLERAIEIANRPGSPFRNQVPILYMRMALGIREHDPEKADKIFIKALNIAKGPNSNSLQILYHWGVALRYARQFDMSAQKLNDAYSQACLLAPKDRGDFFAKLLQELALNQSAHGKKRQAELTLKRYEAELELQKKLNSKISPNEASPM